MIVKNYVSDYTREYWSAAVQLAFAFSVLQLSPFVLAFQVLPQSRAVAVAFSLSKIATCSLRAANQIAPLYATASISRIKEKLLKRAQILQQNFGNFSSEFLWLIGRTFDFGAWSSTCRGFKSHLVQGTFLGIQFHLFPPGWKLAAPPGP